MTRAFLAPAMRDVKECSSMARAPVSKTGGWGFESLHSCQLFLPVRLFRAFFPIFGAWGRGGGLNLSGRTGLGALRWQVSAV